MRSATGFILFISIVTLLTVSCQKKERIDPLISTGEAQNIGSTQVTMIGELHDMGVRTNWDYGFIWSDVPGANISTGNIIYLGNRTETGSFSALRDRLSPATTYYFKSFVANPGFTQIFYGNERDFTTLP